MRKVRISEIESEVSVELIKLKWVRDHMEYNEIHDDLWWARGHLTHAIQVLETIQKGMVEALQNDSPIFDSWEDGFLAGFKARCNQDCGTYPRRWERNEAFKRQYPDAPIPAAAGNEGADQTVLN
jgi:hypothetical protein